MKINELKRIAEENDYEYEMRHFQYKLKKMQGTNCITISNDVEKTLWISNKCYCDKKDFNMIKAAVEFSETPIPDREEEKKYYLWHKFLRDETGFLSVGDYLNYNTTIGCYFLGSDESNYLIKTQFTEKEIEEIKEKFDTDLKDFELIEVEI